MNKRVFEEYDEDRKRLAQFVHSGPAQYLAALQLNLALIPAGELPPRAAKALADCAELAQICSRELRAVSNRLNPPLLEEAGLAAAVRAFATEAGIKLMPDIPESLGPLPLTIAISAFRIIEELILELENPAGATLHVVHHSDLLEISVAGAGEIRASVRERVNSHGGRFSVTPFKAVTVYLPLTAEES